MSKQEQPRAPVKYVVLEKSLIGNEIHEAGATVEYAGLPAENLQPTCKVGEARYQEYLESNAKRVRAMHEAHRPLEAGGSAEAFAAAVGKAIAEANASFQAQLTDAIAAALSKAARAKPAKGKTAEKAEDAIA